MGRRIELDEATSLAAKERNSWDDGVRAWQAGPAPWSLLIAALLLGSAVAVLVLWLVFRTVDAFLQLS